MARMATRDYPMPSGRPETEHHERDIKGNTNWSTNEGKLIGKRAEYQPLVAKKGKRVKEQSLNADATKPYIVVPVVRVVVVAIGAPAVVRFVVPRTAANNA